VSVAGTGARDPDRIGPGRTGDRNRRSCALHVPVPTEGRLPNRGSGPDLFAA